MREWVDCCPCVTRLAWTELIPVPATVQCASAHIRSGMISGVCSCQFPAGNARIQRILCAPTASIFRTIFPIREHTRAPIQCVYQMIGRAFVRAPKCVCVCVRVYASCCWGIRMNFVY